MELDWLDCCEEKLDAEALEDESEVDDVDGCEKLMTLYPSPIGVIAVMESPIMPWRLEAYP